MPDQPPTQREYWSGKAGDEWAAQAERIDAMLAPIAEVIIQAGAVQAGERVLDIGCGAGATSIAIARRVGAGGGVTGVDLSPQLLGVARRRAAEAGAPAEFVEADAGVATFAQPFDVAFSRFGVMFFEAPAAAFAHIRSTLRADGRMAFACWRPIADNPWATIPMAAIEAMLTAPPARPDPDAPGPYSLADKDKVERILRNAEWRDVAVTAWDGGINVGGGGSLEEISDFLLRIGPTARAIAEQSLDVGEARRRLMDRLAPLYQDNGVVLPGACWIVTAKA